MMRCSFTFCLVLAVGFLPIMVISFSPMPRTDQVLRSSPSGVGGAIISSRTITTTALQERISDKRRKQLGIGDAEDEYDLGMALDANTDPIITKIIAGSLILAILGGLVAGIIIPALTDYGEGVCQPLLTGGRC